MAKSKQQKQDEARERKLPHVQRHRQSWMDLAGGRTEWVQKLGTEMYEQRLKEARQKFERACEEAGVDTHGNPIND